MLPTIQCLGNVVDEPTLKFTAQGKAVVSFRMACNSSHKDDTTGKWVDGDSCFLSISAWDALAENITESVSKGTEVSVVGKLKQREYTAKDGSQRTVYQVSAESVAVSLKRASATITKASRSGVSSNAADDPWAMPTASASAGDDEPPF